MGDTLVRHAAQTGTRVNSVSVVLQMRHSSGKTSEKKPYGTLRRTEGRATREPEGELLLEKTHLRRRCHSSPLSCSFWQRIQCRAQGTASSRFFSTDSPHSAHWPKPPFSARCKAACTRPRIARSESLCWNRDSFVKDPLALSARSWVPISMNVRPSTSILAIELINSCSFARKRCLNALVSLPTMIRIALG